MKTQLVDYQINTKTSTINKIIIKRDKDLNMNKTRRYIIWIKAANIKSSLRLVFPSVNKTFQMLSSLANFYPIILQVPNLKRKKNRLEKSKILNLNSKFTK